MTDSHGGILAEELQLVPDERSEFFLRWKNMSVAPWKDASPKDNSEIHDLKLALDDIVGSETFPNQTKTHYVKILERLHAELKPRVYVELGVFKGKSLKLAANCLFALGVDPSPILENPEHFEHSPFIMVPMQSDDFFAYTAPSFFLIEKVDLAFIDGLHIFEYALRDFIGCEMNARGPASTICVHDVLPRTAVEASRIRVTVNWTGDVWRLIYVLKKYRPDLTIKVYDALPTGIAVISNLDPKNNILMENYEAIVREAVAFPSNGFLQLRDVLFQTTNC